MALDTPSPPPPRPFDKLPLKLIQLIVDLVGEQDKAFLKSRMKRGKSHHVRRPDWDRNGDEEAQAEHERQHAEWVQAEKEAESVPLEGKWSCWLGRGTAALSLVDKRLRNLTFLSLCETVTVKQLAQPLFREVLVKRAEVVAVMHHLDLRNSTSQLLLLAIDAISSTLPITRITLNDRTSALTSPFPVPADTNLSDLPTEVIAGELLRRKAKTVAEFAAEDLSTDKLEFFLGIIDLPALRKLEITFPCEDASGDFEQFTFEEAYPKVLDAFRQMSSLESLAIEDDLAYERDYAVHPSWLRSFSLLALRSLTVWAREGGPSLLDLAAAMAPNLQILLVNELEVYRELDVAPLPSIQHLRIHSLGPTYLYLSKTSSLVTVTIDTAPSDTRDWVLDLPSPSAFPPSLCLITLILEATNPPDAELAEYRSQCSKKGVFLRVVWTPNLYVLGEALAENGYGEPYDYGSFLPDALEAARDTMDWARRELDRAWDMEDDRTAHEIIQALYRVRERQAISLQ